MKIDPNSPAFPTQHSIDNNWVTEPIPEFRGLSIRAHIATQMMAGLVAAPSSFTLPGGLQASTGGHFAKIAVEYADTLIEALNGKAGA